ncbi:MAG: hypothetical protein WCH20_07430 [Nitrospira sp.]|jgi:hypothetical protein
MPTVREQITDVAFELLKKHPEGIRYGQLVRGIGQSNGAFNQNTIRGTIWNLDATHPHKVYKPSRGLFRLVEFRDQTTDQIKPELLAQPDKKIKEEDFYASFADWLVNDLEECTKAIPLGGNRFRDKWGTPDVVGKRESKQSDIIKAHTDIVSAEIKTDSSQLVTAFGQACAYCVFCHRSYLVIPASSPDDELSRLDALCQVFGIGLILFNADSPENPGFSIRVRARRQEPDLFYTNKYMKLVEAEMFSG